MSVSYKKLWKLLIDRDMYKKDLRLAAGLSTNAIAKLGKNENRVKRPIHVVSGNNINLFSFSPIDVLSIGQ